MLLGSKTATNNQEEYTRLRLFWRLFFPCDCPVAAPVIRLFFFEKCRFYGRLRPRSDQISCSLQGLQGEKRSRCKRRLHFRKIGESKKGIDLLPLDAKTNPRIHPLWRL
jgi:hypothetical protein